MNLSEALDAIYAAYPRRKGPRTAKLQIDLAIRRLCAGELKESYFTQEQAVLFLLAKTSEFALSPAGNRGHFTLWPERWFKKSCYLDDTNTWHELTRDEQRDVRMGMEANIGVWRPQ